MERERCESRIGGRQRSRSVPSRWSLLPKPMTKRPVPGVISGSMAKEEVAERRKTGAPKRHNRRQTSGEIMALVKTEKKGGKKKERSLPRLCDSFWPFFFFDFFSDRLCPGTLTVRTLAQLAVASSHAIASQQTGAQVSGKSDTELEQRVVLCLQDPGNGMASNSASARRGKGGRGGRWWARET